MKPRPPTKASKGKLPYVFIVGGALMLAVAAGLLLRAPTPVSATPTFLGLAEAQYPFIVGTRIDTCNLCHVANAIPSLNPYGTDFLNHGASAAALAAIENIDSDGDGFTNIQELQALTFPGDPNDHPAAASTATATSAPTKTPTTVPTSLPTNTPTSVPTNTPTGAPTNTPTTVPSSTPTGVPTVAPTVGLSMTPTVGPTTTETGVVPTETEEPILPPIPSGTVVVPTPVLQCNPDDERSENIKTKHGQEEAAEQRLCREHEDEGSEVNEAHEGSLGQPGNPSNIEDNEQQEGDNGQQGANNNQNDNRQQGNIGNDASFATFIKLWLSQWNTNVRFHD